MSTNDGNNRKPGVGGDILPAEREPLYARIYAVVRLIPNQ